MDPNEVSPIFHQFLDAVYQLQCQAPKAFEFNERFLRRLFYQVYAGQYGEFLFNNERERSEHADKLPSAWGYFLARRAEFTNAEFAAKKDDLLLFPRRQGVEREVEVRWWNMLFGRKDEEMNVPRALAQPERSAFESRSASAGVAEILAMGSSAMAPNTLPASVGPTSSTATPDATLEATVATTVGGESELANTKQTTASKRPPMASQETDDDVLARYVGQASASGASEDRPALQQTETEQEKPEPVQQTTGDPLGVSTEEPQHRQPQRMGGMDFAAFAQQNAFKDS